MSEKVCDTVCSSWKHLSKKACVEIAKRSLHFGRMATWDGTLHVYIYIYIFMNIHIYIYIQIERDMPNYIFIYTYTLIENLIEDID